MFKFWKFLMNFVQFEINKTSWAIFTGNKNFISCYQPPVVILNDLFCPGAISRVLICGETLLWGHCFYQIIDNDFILLHRKPSWHKMLKNTLIEELIVVELCTVLDLFSVPDFICNMPGTLWVLQLVKEIRASCSRFYLPTRKHDGNLHNKKLVVAFR